MPDTTQPIDFERLPLAEVIPAAKRLQAEIQALTGQVESLTTGLETERGALTEALDAERTAREEAERERDESAASLQGEQERTARLEDWRGGAETLLGSAGKLLQTLSKQAKKLAPDAAVELAEAGPAQESEADWLAKLDAVGNGTHPEAETGARPEEAVLRALDLGDYEEAKRLRGALAARGEPGSRE